MRPARVDALFPSRDIYTVWHKRPRARPAHKKETKRRKLKKEESRKNSENDEIS
jgi:hypothetical protein